MAYRTIRRNPMSVEVNSLSEQYFNFAQYGGINSNKNYVGVNQYSFEDANNVYVDQNSQLHTRPPIKSITIDVFEPNEYPIDIVKVNNITFYKTYNGSGYKYRFKYNDIWYTCNTTEKSLVYFLNDTFIVFNENSVYMFQYDNGSFTSYSNSVYTPITKIIQGDSVTENEFKNILTTAEITRYLFEYGSEITPNTVSLIGKTVTVNIDGSSYTFTFKSGNQIVFVSPLSSIDISFVDGNDAGQRIQFGNTGDEKVILIDDGESNFYLSQDGISFSQYSYPEGANIANGYRLVLSDDGTCIWFATCELVNETDDDNITTSFAKVYCMNVPFLNNFSGWQVSLVEVMRSAGSTIINDDNYEFNVAVESLDGDSIEAFNMALTDIDLNSVNIHSPETGIAVILFHSELGGYLEKNNSTSYSNGNGASHISFDAYTFIVCNNMEFKAYHSCINNRLSTHKLIINSTNFEYPYSNAVNIKFIKTNSASIIVLYGPVACNAYYVNDSTMTGAAGTFYKNSIMYCYLNSNMEPQYSMGIFAPTVSDANNFDSTNDRGNRMAVLPAYFNELYAYRHSLNTINYQYLQNSAVDNRTVAPSYRFDTVCSFLESTLSISFVFNYASLTNRYSDTIDSISTSAINRINNYDQNDYNFKYEYNNSLSNTNNRMNYPYSPFYVENLNGTYTTLEDKNDAIVLHTETINNTTYADMTEMFRFAKDSNNYILTSNYYYYQGVVYPLLNNNVQLYPVSVSQDGSNIIYINNSNHTLYTNEYDGYATIDILTAGNIKYIVPDFAEDFITTTIALDNLIYQLVNRRDDNDRILLYFPENTEVKFVDKITNLIVFSQTSLGVFLEDLVYEYQYDTSNDVYTLTPTKLQLGCKEGADILIGYDGSTIYMTQLKGLAGLNYQDFVQSTEQVYTYFTDAIMDLYDKFKGDGKIKLYQYKDWIFMYKQDNTELYIFDTRSNTWWKWTNPYPIQKIVFDGDNLLLLINNQIAIYNFEDNSDFSDFIGTEITWHFRSQKLHFNAPNNYKHIRQLNIITAQDGIELRYKLRFINYRNLNNLSETDTVLFDIDQLTTLIKRVNFMKTNAFQFEISSDETDPHPKHFETPDIVIKYRITEAVR